MTLYSMFAIGVVEDHLQYDKHVSEMLHIYPEHGIKRLSAEESPKTLSVLDLLHHTSTPMGSRCLRDWLHKPLQIVNAILYRQRYVRLFVENVDKLSTLRDGVHGLKNFPDMEKLGTCTMPHGQK
jgi:DNA mismatch repair ATPase MutS